MKTLICLSLIFALSMAGGIHRVAQSQWDYPTAGLNTALDIFVMPENTVPVGGYLKIAFPTAANAFVPTKCNAWSLTGVSTLAYPGDTATGLITGTIAGSAPTFYCTWTTALTGGASYGIHLYAASSALAEGQYAPIVLQSTAGQNTGYDGPVIDTNNAFDAVTVAPAANTFTLAGAAVADISGCEDNATAPKCNSKYNNPGETMEITWTMNSFSQKTGAIYAPFDIAITFTAIADDATTKHVYENWQWVATCTNTQWGKKTTNAAGTEVTPVATEAAPTCKATGTKLTISITKDSIAPASEADWGTFVMVWTMSVKQPTDYLGVAAKATAQIVHPTTGNIYATAAEATISSLTVAVLDTSKARTSTSTDGDATVTMGWGYNPFSDEGKIYQGGLRADAFCLEQAKGGYGKTHVNSGSNCYGHDDAGTAKWGAIKYTNALDITWTLPADYNIPDDGTQATMTCKDDLANNQGDPWSVWQSSIVTSVGKGNCWYSMRAAAAGNTHEEIVTCENVGALAGGATLKFGMQMNIGNSKKTFAANIVANGALNNIVCTLVITTAQGTTTNWYTQTITMPIDRSDSGKIYEYETFFYQNGAMTTLTPAANAHVTELGTIGTATWSQPLFDMVAPTFGQTAATAKYQAGAGAVSPLVLMMVYIFDCHEATLTATKSRKLPFALAGLYVNQDNWALQVVMAGAQDQATSGFSVQWWTSKKAGITTADNGNMALEGNAGDIDSVTANDGGAQTFDTTNTKFLKLDDSVMQSGTGGKFTQSVSGKANIFSTTWLGNPAATTPATFYAAKDHFDECTKANDDTESGTAKTWNGLFQWCFIKLGVTAKTGQLGVRDAGGSDVTSTAGNLGVATGVYLLKNPLSFAGWTLPRFFQFQYVNAWSYTNTAMTSFRGGSNHDANTQSFDQHIWCLRSNKTQGTTDSWFIQGLITVYVANAKAYQAQADGADVGAKVAWPFWTEISSTDNTVAKSMINAGNYHWNVFKVSFVKDKAHLGNFIGAFMPHGQPFMKSTGGNEVEVIATWEGAQCWHYGSKTGNKFVASLTNVVNANGNTIAGKAVAGWTNPYAADFRIKNYNFMVCDISKHTITNDNQVLVVPFVNEYYTVADRSVKLTIAATAGQTITDTAIPTWTQSAITKGWGALFVVQTMHTFVTVFGADKYLHKLEWICNNANGAANANWVDAIGTTMAHNAMVDNAVYGAHAAAGTALATFTLAADTGSSIEIGKAGVTVIFTLGFNGNVLVDWMNVVEIVQVCGDATYFFGSNFGGMTQDTGDKSAYITHTQSITLGLNVYNVQCFFGDGAAAGTANTVKFATFQMPVTDDKKVIGMTVLGNNAATVNYLLPSVGSTTLMTIGQVSECGPASAVMQTKIPGQSVKFTMTSPSALMGGWRAVWRPSTLAFSAAQPAADSVVATCGSTTLTGGTLTYSNDYLQYTLPETANTANIATSGTAVNVATYAATCAGAAQVSMTINSWNPASATAVAEFSGKCHVNIKASSDSDDYKRVTTDAVQMGADQSSVQFKFAQTGTTDKATCTSTASFTPNVANSHGYMKFTVGLGSGASVYAGYTKFAVTFGNFAFASNNVCQVMNTLGTAHTQMVKSCVVSGAQATIILSGSSTGFAVFIRNAGKWTYTAATNTLAVTATNYETAVQVAPTGDSKLTMPAVPAEITGTTTTLALTKRHAFTLDQAYFNFTVTLVKATVGKFDSTQYALVQFPTYYPADLGGHVLCSIQGGTAAEEDLYCAMAWDWTLQIWGPATNNQVVGTAFHVLVKGVRQVNTGASNKEKIQFGVSNSSGTLASNTFSEMGEVDDSLLAADAGWKAKQALHVYGVYSTSLDTRSTTNLQVDFQLPKPSTSVTEGLTNSGMVSLELPNSWGNVFAAGDKPSSVSISLNATGTATSLGTTLSSLSGNCITVAMLAASKWEDEKNYTLKVDGVPTPQFAASGALGSFVLSIGKANDGEGSYAWSDHQQFNFDQPSYAVKTGLTELKFSVTTVTVNRGTYSGAFKILPAANNFAGAVTFEVNTPFKTWPASLSAVQGQESTGGKLGIASTAQAKWYYVTFTKTEGATTVFTALPNFLVQVDATQATVSVPSKVQCTLNGTSVPVKAYVDALPFSDLTVTLKVTTYNASVANAVNPSQGITPKTGEDSVAFSTARSKGFLMFDCNTTIQTTSPTLTFELSGTDKAQYKLSTEKPSVESTAWAAKLTGTDATVTWAFSTDLSTAPVSTMSGNCPDQGLAYGWFAPVGTTAPSDSNVASSANTYITARDADPNYNGAAGAQYCKLGVESKTSTLACSFDSVSATNYTSILFCTSGSGHSYQSTAVSVTSVDNGGLVVGLKYTFTKQIDAIKNNDVVLSIACALAKGLTLANDRVTDAFGGYCNTPSKYLPASAPVTATANTTTNTTDNTTTNTTANTTTRILADATNTTTANTTTYSIEIFILPDPTAASQDNSIWLDKVKALQGDVDKLTETNFGKSVVTLTGPITEVAVAWGTQPTHAVASNNLLVTISGTTSVGGNVYCAFQTVGTAATATTRLLADNTTANTTTDTTTTTTNTTTTAAVTSIKDWSSATFSAANTLQRTQTTDTAKSFSQDFETKQSKTSALDHPWACQGTSLNPNPAAAKFYTTYVTATANIPIIDDAGYSLVVNALLSMIVGIALFFF